MLKRKFKFQALKHLEYVNMNSPTKSAEENPPKLGFHSFSDTQKDYFKYWFCQGKFGGVNLIFKKTNIIFLFFAITKVQGLLAFCFF